MKIFDHKILKNIIYSLIVVIFAMPISIKASDNDIEEILVVGSRINNQNLKKILPVTIINSEEIRNSWDLQNKFMISNPAKNDQEIIRSYDNQIKKISEMNEYSSKIAPHHTKNELIEIIEKSDLLNHKDD